MRIAVLGAGGVGGYYGGVLARAGHEVVMLARGAHLDALRARGIEIRTPEERFTVPVEATDDPGTLSRIDHTIVAVKNYSLPEIAPVAGTLGEAGALVVPLLNGVEVVDRLVALACPARSSWILGGLTAISVVRAGARHRRTQEFLPCVVVGRGGRW